MIRYVRLVTFTISAFFFFAFATALFKIITINNNLSLDFYHIISLFFIVLIIIKQKIVFPNKYIILYFCYAILISLINAPSYGLNRYFIAYFFNFYLIVSIMTIGVDFNINYWCKIIRRVSIALICLVVINIIVFNFESLLNVYYFGGRLTLTSTVLGEINTESVWLAMFGVLFIKRKRGYIYISLSTVIAILYASRAGLIANILVILWAVCSNFASTTQLKGKTERIRLVTVITILIGVTLLLLQAGLLNTMIQRFISIGRESASISRLDAWHNGWIAWTKNPLGYGVGNATIAAGFFRTPDNTELLVNIHNIYMQTLIDLGIIGFLSYLVFIIYFFIYEIKRKFQNPFAAIIAIYFIIGFVQFSGVSVLFAFFLGIYFCTKNGDRVEDISISRQLIDNQVNL